MQISQRGKRSTTLEDRVRELEDQVTALTEAVRLLAHGLEDLPTSEPRGKQAAEAARRAYDLLLVTGSPAGQQGQHADG